MHCDDFHLVLFDLLSLSPTDWQSDGMSQPHLIQVHFARRVAISHACIYLDYNLDESYTPKHISIQVGMTTQDLVPAVYSANIVELNEPVGWVIIPLTSQPDPLDYITGDDLGENGLSKSRRLVRTHFVQVRQDLFCCRLLIFVFAF